MKMFDNMDSDDKAVLFGAIITGLIPLVYQIWKNLTAKNYDIKFKDFSATKHDNDLKGE